MGWDYVKFHPDYNKMQSPALCGERDSEGGRRPSERTSTTNHPFPSIYIYKEESAFGCLFAMHSVPVIGSVTLTFHGTSLGPGEGQEEIGTVKGVMWVRVGVWVELADILFRL